MREVVNVLETANYVKGKYAKNVVKDFSLVQISALHVQVTAKNVQVFGTAKNTNQTFKRLTDSVALLLVLVAQQLNAILANLIIS